MWSVYTYVSETSLLCKPVSNQFKLCHVNRVRDTVKEIARRDIHNERAREESDRVRE